MRVGRRLYLAVLPAAVGVLLLGALSYWGERGRQAPRTVVLVGVLAVAGSLAISWRNTRYVAGRIERLARAQRAPAVGTGDELTAIEGTVTELRDEVTATQDASRRRLQEAERRIGEYVALVEGLAGPVADRLREAQLPLHILLESRFGELNENQEEMIEAARLATDAADEALRHVRRVLELDRAAAAPAVESVRVADLVRPALAIATACAAEAGSTIRVEVPPDLPRVMVEPYLAEEALTAVFREAVERTNAGGTVIVQADARHGAVELEVRHEGDAAASLDMLLAQRLLRAAGGELDVGSRMIRVHLTSSHARSAVEPSGRPPADGSADFGRAGVAPGT